VEQKLGSFEGAACEHLEYILAENDEIENKQQMKKT
jgi:hypothetical protein